MEIDFRFDEEFDLQASVYEVGLGQHIQTYAEHAGSFNLKPKRGALAIDLSGAPTISTPGETRFSFTKRCHRELAFSDESALRTFLTGILGTISSRLHRTENSDIPRYVAERIVANDPEWVAFCSDSQKPKDWGCTSQ